MSLYYDPGVLVKLYVREEGSDAVARFLAARGEAVIVNDLHELEIRNALRLKRFRDEIGGQQLAASMAMLASDLAAGCPGRDRLGIGVCGGGAPVHDHDRRRRGGHHRSAPRRHRTRSDGFRVGVAGPPTVRRGPRIGPRRGRTSGLTAGVSLDAFQPLCDGRLNIPDVFRMGCGLGRHGGVKPVR